MTDRNPGLTQLADRFVKDPREVVKAGDIVQVRVLEVDTNRKRIALSKALNTFLAEEGVETVVIGGCAVGAYARLMGERGTLHVLHRWLVWCPRDGWPRPVGRGRREHSEEAGLLDQLADSIATGRPADTSGDDNLHTVAIVEACERAARTGHAVDPRALLAPLEDSP